MHGCTVFVYGVFRSTQKLVSWNGKLAIVVELALLCIGSSEYGPRC